MNNNILKSGVQHFINKNMNTDIMSVLLKKPVFEAISQKELVEQLEAKKKCQHKLPTWFKTPNIYYPNKRNIEQSSSEKTARYKANLVHGKTLLDSTGGFGIDTFFFSKKIDQVFHCELDENLSQIATHNLKILGVRNCTFVFEDSINFVMHYPLNFDWIYMDPSRRNRQKEKVFLLEDYEPPVLQNLDILFTKTTYILLKSSPLLDIKQGIAELKYVKEVHIVAVNNEVKELLWILESEFKGSVCIKTVNLKNNHTQTFNFKIADEAKAKILLDSPKSFLYEPNTAILKAGAFKTLGEALKLRKLHQHSHLYTSENHFPHFPGRSFKIIKTIAATKKKFKSLGIIKANITVRNFPETVATIRKKYGIQDGGDSYLFFTTDNANQKVVILCAKV